MSLPKVVYRPDTTDVTLQFQRGPQDFRVSERPVAHDNVSTSGVRERVVERQDILIAFAMPAMSVTDDLGSWAAFSTWALAGGSFKFYPNAALSDYYNCLSEDEAFEPVRVGPGRYSCGFRFRIVHDDQAPADPSVILRRFYGVTT